MATNGAPDNWDDEEMDVSNKISSLNVSAPAFVPNVNAPAFVPSWGAPTPEEAPKEVPKAASEEPAASPDNGNGMQVDQPSPAGNGPAADSWEAKADMSSSATTPEDEDMSMEDDSGNDYFLVHRTFLVI